ncbi:MAG: hypothetical protein QW727_01490 [Candidatus Pacearchaeota archaeon]
MGLFKFRRKQKTIDFTDFPDIETSLKNDLKNESKSIEIKTTTGNIQEKFEPIMELLDSQSNLSLTDNNDISQVSEISELKVKLKNMTLMIEDASNEIYKLMQKIELLEKKIQRLENRKV